MGQDKALIHLAGNPLIQHALTILRSAGLEPRIAGAQQRSFQLSPRSLPDDPSQSGLGPLPASAPRSQSSTAQFAVFLPVDLPLLPACLIDYLFHRAIITESAITAVSIAGFIQTFPVVVDRAAPHSPVQPAFQRSQLPPRLPRRRRCPRQALLHPACRTARSVRPGLASAGLAARRLVSQHQLPPGPRSRRNPPRQKHLQVS